MTIEELQDYLWAVPDLAQAAVLEGVLAQKPTRHGFPTDQRTGRRVADLIRQK